MILFHHFQLAENDEIVSSKYTMILIKSLLVLYFETTKKLIFGVCFILYFVIFIRPFFMIVSTNETMHLFPF